MTPAWGGLSRKEWVVRKKQRVTEMVEEVLERQAVVRAVRTGEGFGIRRKRTEERHRDQGRAE